MGGIYAAPILQDLNYIIQAPPKTEDPNSLYQWIYQIYQRWMQCQITTQEPNGNIDAGVGSLIVYHNTSTAQYYLAVETTSPQGTTWVGILLGSV